MDRMFWTWNLRLISLASYTILPAEPEADFRMFPRLSIYCSDEVTDAGDDIHSHGHVVKFYIVVRAYDSYSFNLARLLIHRRRRQTR